MQSTKLIATSCYVPSFNTDERRRAKKQIQVARGMAPADYKPSRVCKHLVLARNLSLIYMKERCK